MGQSTWGHLNLPSTQSSNPAMKSLLVCLAFAAMAFADEEAATVPLLHHPFYHGLGLGYAHHPIVQHQPIQYKYVPEEVEIPIHSVKFVPPETACYNDAGVAVPCARRKRDAEETEAVAAPALLPYHFGYHAPLHYGYPVVKPVPGCYNGAGALVPCAAPGTWATRRRRDAEETEAVAAPAVLPYHFGYPYHYGYHGYPVVKPLEPKIVEIPVKTPVYKHVVEEVPLGPACQNHLGLAVPCA